MTTTINNEHKKLNVPNLRFKEFQGEWDKCELGEFATIIGGYAFKSETLNSIGGKYQVVKMGNLYQNQLDLHRSPSYTDTLTRKAENVILRKDDIAITLTGTNNKRDFGYTYIFNDEKNLLLNQRCGLIRAKGNPYFLSCLLKTHTFLNQFFESATGGTGNQANVSTKAMEMFSVNTPSLKEQEKIGQLMALLDERIATQNKIIDKLQSLIKGISSRIFASIQGIEYRMGDIVTITNGNSNVQDAVTQSKDGLYPFFDRSEDIKYLPTFLFDKEAIIYPGEGTEFMPRYFKGKFALHQRCYAIFDFNDIINARFLYFYLKTRNSYFVKNAVGSTVPSLRLDTFQKLKVIIPPKKIQHSVSLCLSSMEQKCNVEEKILHKLLKQKQYLLRQMFI